MFFWHLISRISTRYAPVFVFPFAAVVGAIGYSIERLISDRYTPGTAPIVQQREERLLANMDATPKKHNPLEVNLSPSLSN